VAKISVPFAEQQSLIVSLYAIRIKSGSKHRSKEKFEDIMVESGD
jgi:hypothetical protein